MAASWIPTDLATWLAIIALILVVPLNFLSSWAYPKLQNWWAARSRKSLQKRIDKLKASLADMYDGRALTRSEEWVLLCAEQLASLIFWGAILILAVVFVLTAPLVRTVRHPKLLAVIIAVFVAAYRTGREYLMFEIRGLRRFAGPRTRAKLQIDIEELEAKLAAREHRASGLDSRA